MAGHSADRAAEGPAEHRPGAGLGTTAGGGSTLAAFGANLGVALAKLVVWTVTGSASLLAEVVHSFADTGNQGLLLVGRRRAGNAPNRRHPFGYGRERYFWSFVVAVVLFSAGSLFALAEGEEKLRTPHEPGSYGWSIAVLAVAFGLEGVSLRTAANESRRRKRGDESWRAFIARTTVPELAVILLEDSAALTGIVLAALGTTLAALTGNPRFDALGSLAIGMLLAGVAFTLAADMKSVLIGEGAPPAALRQIRDAILSDPDIVELADLRTEILGPEQLLVVAAVGTTARSAVEVETTLARLESCIRSAVPSVHLVYVRAQLASDVRRHSGSSSPGKASP